MQEQEEEYGTTHIPPLMNSSKVKVPLNTSEAAQFAHMFLVGSRYACETASNAVDHGHTDGELAKYEIQKISSRATAAWRLDTESLGQHSGSTA